MKIFSNGQFDTDYEEYYFYPETKTFSPAIESVSQHLSSTLLVYRSHKILDFNDMKKFYMGLIHNGKVIKEQEGEIYRSGPNKDYESKVRDMQKKAYELSKMETPENLPEIPEVAIK